MEEGTRNWTGLCFSDSTKKNLKKEANIKAINNYLVKFMIYHYKNTYNILTTAALNILSTCASWSISCDDDPKAIMPDERFFNFWTKWVINKY